MNNVKTKVNIVDVIKRYIPLQKRGNSWVGICPFHDDHTPSLSVSEKLQLFKCFTCETRGDVINFVEKFNNVSYCQAIEIICRDFGIELDQKHADEIQKANAITQKFFPYWDLCDSIRRFYNDELLKAIREENQVVINFLKKRGITYKLIETFQIGYAPQNSNLLTKAFLDSIDDEKIRNEYERILDELGYFDKKGNDFFSNRIIFPILDGNENVVGFSGRTLSEDVNVPKYLNSKESLIFKKENVLFNFAYNKKKNFNKIYLVEGFMEVISLWKIGVRNAIALMGTSFSEHHVKLLKEITNLEHIVICLDQDIPGQKASINIARRLIKAPHFKKVTPEWTEINYWIVTLSKKIPFKDLDEFIRYANFDEIRNYLHYSINYFRWYTEFLLATSTIDDKVLKLNDIAIKVLFEIKQLTDALLIPKSYVEELAKNLSLNVENLCRAYDILGKSWR